MAAANPFEFDPTAPDPWALPLAALELSFYPEVDSSVAPLLEFIGALGAVEIAVCLANVALRWKRAPIHLFKVQGGVLIPSTVILWNLLAAGFLAAGQAQVWIDYRIVREKGTFSGIYLARGFTCACGILLLYVQTLGLMLSTAFNAHAVKSQAAFLPIEWTSVFNAVTVSIPVVAFFAIMGPAVAGEVVCMKQWNNFKKAMDIGLSAEQQQLNGGTFDPQAAQAFGGQVAKVQASSCARIEKGLYGELAFWIVAAIVGIVASYVLLSHKLSAQIGILQRSARTFKQLEDAGALPGEKGEKGNELSLSPSAGTAVASWDYYQTYGKEVTEEAPPYDQDRERETRRARKQEARAKALKMGLNQLRWISALGFVGSLLYLANDLIITVKGKKVQTSGSWSAITNLLGLYIFCLFGGSAILIIFIAGLNPARSSFLGIPIQPLEAEDEQDAASISGGGGGGRRGSHSGSDYPSRSVSRMAENPFAASLPHSASAASGWHPRASFEPAPDDVEGLSESAAASSYPGHPPGSSGSGGAYGGSSSTRKRPTSKGSLSSMYPPSASRRSSLASFRERGHSPGRGIGHTREGSSSETSVHKTGGGGRPLPPHPRSSSADSAASRQRGPGPTLQTTGLPAAQSTPSPLDVWVPPASRPPSQYSIRRVPSTGRLSMEWVPPESRRPSLDSFR